MVGGMLSLAFSRDQHPVFVHREILYPESMQISILRFLIFIAVGILSLNVNAGFLATCLPQALIELSGALPLDFQSAHIAREISKGPLNQLSLTPKMLRELEASRDFHLAKLRSRMPELPKTLRVGNLDYNVLAYLGSGVEADSYLVQRLKHNYVIKKFKSPEQFSSNTQVLSQFSHLTKDLLMPISEHPADQALLYDGLHGVNVLAVEMAKISPRKSGMSPATSNYILKRYEAFKNDNALHPARSNVLVDFAAGRFVIIDPQ